MHLGIKKQASALNYVEKYAAKQNSWMGTLPIKHGASKAPTQDLVSMPLRQKQQPGQNVPLSVNTKE